MGTPEAGAGPMIRNYREGLISRAATFRVGHPAFEDLGPASSSIHQLAI
jgi:hypothetical protein